MCWSLLIPKQKRIWNINELEFTPGMVLGLYLPFHLMARCSSPRKPDFVGSSRPSLLPYSVHTTTLCRLPRFATRLPFLRRFTGKAMQLYQITVRCQIKLNSKRSTLRSLVLKHPLIAARSCTKLTDLSAN